MEEKIAYLRNCQKKHANITTWAVETYKSFCLECQRKAKKQVAAGVVVKPMVSFQNNSRGQVDLTDTQSLSVKNCKRIMVCQDHLTKFCVLRAITSKRAAEVTFQLMDIFLPRGAPVILRSDSGSEFTAHLITELKDVWPSFKLILGRPCHPQWRGPTVI
ncbi:KRAB-A domain-containing protein 2-like [Oratosquilla oratoria]|uniref:KRAB-A domain-containing protein 2-like n=1 Tax=Oratosquilla oratoria TaxID=337810 RepID=UPI003F761706